MAQASRLCVAIRAAATGGNTQADYPRALALGLPIGSGMIESGHRHGLQARLKKAGAAWLPNNADTLAHLRVLKANQLWQSFWN